MTKSINQKGNKSTAFLSVFFTIVIQIICVAVFIILLPHIRNLKMLLGIMVSFASIDIFMVLLVFTLIKPKSKHVHEPIQKSVEREEVVNKNEPPSIVTHQEEFKSEDILSKYEATCFVASEEPTDIIFQDLIKAFLIYNIEEDVHKSEVRNSPFYVGRQADIVDLCIDNKHISRKHMEIIKQEDQYFVKDLESKNKTFLNDIELNPHELTPLASEDVIKLYQFEMKFIIEG